MASASPSRRLPRRQRGGSLVSTLVAVLALALGALAATRVQSQLRTGSESARQRVEALGLAQGELERLRAFPGLEAGTDGRGRDAMSSRTHDISPARGGTAYRIERTVTDDAAVAGSTVQVGVSWHAGDQSSQRVRLTTLLGRVDPALGGALARSAQAGTVARVHGRDPRIPRAAHDLGNGHSVLAPGLAGPGAVVVDNATGMVVAVCRAGGDDPSDRSVGRSGPDMCTPLTGGLLVAGRVRFSLGSAPSALAADDAPLDFEVSLAAATPTAEAPHCGSAARSAGAERWVDYACVVVPAAGTAGWVGRVEIVPAGWEIGTTAGRYRVCRHSAGLPAQQRPVVASVAEQNLLIVAGPVDCPAGTPVEVDGRGTENHADLSTVQHQP